MQLRSLVLALCLAGVAATSQADVYDASFDGAWTVQGQGGRGAVVDYLKLPNGNGQYFIAVFTYDTARNPVWLTVQAGGREGQRIFRGVEVRRFTGGSGSNTFAPPAPGTGTVVGTAVVDISTCNSIRLDVTASAGAPIDSVNFNFRRLEGEVGGSNAVAAECPFTTAFTACPTGTTAVAGQERSCEIAGGSTLTGDVRLNNSATYVLGGRVQVGAAMSTAGVPGASGNLFIEPGTLIRGRAGSLARLVINPGSRLFAEGTPTAPIVMTGPTETGETEQGSWGGLILAGRAPINRNCTGPNSVTCSFEADSQVVWGGTDVNDSSGVLRYLQVRSAGAIVTPPDRDLNSITFGGVGAGTVVDHIQAHNGSDDGLEFFGGTVNVNYAVVTGSDDDGLDFDFGYSGKIQFAFVRSDAGSVADSQGVESDNGASGSDFDALPRTRPILANVTLDGRNLGNDGLRIRRGSGMVLQNIAVVNYLSTCINLNDSPTYLAGAPAGQPTNLSGSLSIAGSFVANCPRLFDDVATDPWLVSAWYNNAAQSNGSGTAAISSILNGRLPALGSPLRSGFVAPDATLDRYPVRGAFFEGDWTEGWTVGLD